MANSPVDRVRRVCRLVARFRVDGGLPPSVGDLYADVVRARAARAVERLIAIVLPARGARGLETHGTAVRIGWRRWSTAGPVATSAVELAHEHARRVIGAMEAAGLHPFLVARGTGTTIGLEIGERAAGWRALGDVLARPGWYARLHRGRRSALVQGPSRSARRARRATRWVIWSLRLLGPEASLGPEQAVVVTFWAPGDRERLERIGVRGQERFARSSPRTIEEVDGVAYPGREALPIGAELAAMGSPVDLVYTWVDGGDAEWLRSFEEWSRRCGVAAGSVAAHPGRYRSHDELRYSLRSAWLFAGWARRIHVVTDGQVPTWLRDHPSVQVVPHHDIFPPDWLPTFNSHAIESRLHHIPGLAEHFVYLNDDVFLGRPLSVTTFFTPNGLPLVFTSGARVVTGSSTAEGGSDLAIDIAATRGQALIQQRYGRTVGYKLHHAPFALRRSLLCELEQEYAAELARTGQHRFRHPDDLSVAASFAHHYAVVTGRAVLGGLDVDYVHLEAGRLGLHLDRLRLVRGFSSFCLNETEEPARGGGRIDRLVGEFLEAYFPVPAPWEANAEG